MAEKRDLVFLWINEEDGIFKDQHINFGSEYVFNVERVENTLTLTAQENQSFITGFFKIGDAGVDNVTAIVGKNGSGKTRLCRSLSLFCQRESFPGSYIAVVHVTDSSGIQRFEVRTSASVEVELVISLPFPNKLITNGRGTTIGDVVYYSPIIDFWNLDKTTSEPRYRDVSSNYLFHAEQGISPARQDIARRPNPLDVARSRDVGMHVALLNSPIGQEVLGAVGGLINGMPSFEVELFDTAHEPRFEYRVSNKYLQLVNVLINTGHQEHEALKGALMNASQDSDQLETQQKIFANRIGHYFLKSFLYHLGNRIPENEQAIDIRIRTFSSSTFLDQIQEFLGVQTVVPAEPFLLFFKGLPEIAVDSRPELPEWEGNTYILTANAFLKIFFLYETVKKELFNLNRYGRNEAELHGFLRFNYTRSLSSGEKAYLDIFSRLFYAREQFEYMTNHHAEWPSNLYVILDEGEIGFHPAWQQGYIKHMVESLPKLFGNSSKGPLPHIHLIVATHSPISLSDIPREHVVVLQTEDQRESGSTIQDQTFGANIHNLYRNSFFLANHLLGDFAHDKIQAVIDDLGKGDVIGKRADEMLATIGLIGEPVIRETLLARYNERFAQGHDDESRLDYYREQIKEIEARRKSRRKDENR